jgi:hypothetical protein
MQSAARVRDVSAWLSDLIASESAFVAQVQVQAPAHAAELRPHRRAQ